MRRMVFLLAMTLSVAGVAYAQGAEEPDKRVPPPLPSEHPAQLPINPTAPDAGVESQVYLGDVAPDFRLDSSLGRPFGLSDLKGAWAVVVFDPSRKHLGTLATAVGGLKSYNARLYGVCSDAAPALRSFAEREGVAFPLLSDGTGQVAQLYGMYDDTRQDIAPGLVLLDPNGVVRLALYGQSMHEDEVVQLVKHAVAGL
jgi:peroxiredoxin